MQKLKITAQILTLTALGVSNLAQADISANIGATSNYVWRGVTQTMDGAAVSGGIDFSHDSGFYLGAWTSNIDWGKGATGAELDLYAGFSGKMESLDYDLGVIHYNYPNPNTQDANFTEVYGSISFNIMTFGVNYTVNGESGQAFDSGDIYYYGSALFDLNDNWKLKGTVGHYSFDKANDQDYNHAQLDITKSTSNYGDFTFSLSKVFGEQNGSTYNTDLIPYVSWSKTF